MAQRQHKLYKPRHSIGRGSSGVEQLIRNQQVVGSNPILGSSILHTTRALRNQT